jgi:ATP-dependent helicase/nuclease subunit A
MEKFTAAQQEAITSAAENIIVFAGAGSGKTRVLTERYKNILTGLQINPANVLAITFTNQATEAMKERIGYLPEAEITTFHSLAVKILREQALERGVHPQFSILDESMAKVSLLQTIEKLIRANALGETYRADELLDVFLQIMAKGFEVKEVKRVMTEANGQICLQLKEINQKIYHCFADLEEIVRSLKNGSNTQAKIELLLSNKNEILALINQLSAETENAWYKLTRYLEELKRLQQPAKEMVDELINQLQNYLLLIYEVQDLPNLEEIFSLLTQVEEEYVHFKTANQLLDFWELEKQLLHLLKNDSQVRNYYQKKYPYILVDEFQDTNNLQKEILSLLAGANLFLVGDPRQAIYGFREGNSSLEYFGNKSFQRINLAENFRSHRQILGFVNSIYQIIGAGELNELIPGDTKKDQGAVRLVQLEKGRSRREEMIAEANTIAQIIKRERINEGAILLQTSSHMPVFKQVLQSNGIACTVMGEEKFFNSAVVWSLNSFLKLILQPANQLARYEVLQAFFPFGSQELNMIKRPKCFISLLAKKKRGQYIDDLGVKGEEALDLVQKIITMARAMSTVELVLMWLQETAYWHKLSWGEEKIVACWLEKVRYLERELGWSKGEVLSYFEEAEKLGCRDKEAISAEHRGIVISTVHQAKGLEYPVVFLADLQRKIPPITKKFLISSQGVLCKKVLDSEGKWLNSYSFKMSAEAEWKQNKEEKWRLFYVALTRAQQTLYLIGCGNSYNSKVGPNEQSSWWGLLQKLRNDLLTGQLYDENLSPLSSSFDIAHVQEAHVLDEEGVTAKLDKDLGTNIKNNQKKINNININLNRPWAVSSLADLAICSKKFYYRYLLNMPEIRKNRTGSFNSTLYGSFIHKVLEKWDGSKELEEVILETGARFFLAKNELKSFMNKAVKQLQKIPKEYLFPVERVSILKEMPVTFSTNGHTIYGVIDQLILGENWIRIVDYKTENQGKLKNKHIVQLELYALGINNILSPKNVSAGILFLTSGEFKLIDINETVLAFREQWLTEKLSEMNGRITDGDFAANKGDECFICSYRNICPK